MKTPRRVLSLWVDELLLADLAMGLTMTPTPSRGQTIHNLTANTYHPFELIPETWGRRKCNWDTGPDTEREAPLQDADAVRSYARSRLLDWQLFLLDADGDLPATVPSVRSPREEVTFGLLLISQRHHCAHHHRQIRHFRRDLGDDVSRMLDVESITGPTLPERVN